MTENFCKALCTKIAFVQVPFAKDWQPDATMMVINYDSATIL